MTSDGEAVTIGGDDENFVTEFSSVPFGLRWFVHWTRVDTAGVVHDYLYQRTLFSRLKDDCIWFQIARSSHPRAFWWQAAGGWVGMRLLGWLWKSTGNGCSAFARIRVFWAPALLDAVLFILVSALAGYFTAGGWWMPGLLVLLLAVLNYAFRA